MLRYRIEQINDIRILVVEGQISVSERDLLKNLLEKEKIVPESRYILDLSHVFYIDSYGISFIQNLILGADSKKRVTIVSDKDYINYVIRFNKIDKLLKVKFVSSMDDAIDRYREEIE